MKTTFALLSFLIAVTASAADAQLFCSVYIQENNSEATTTILESTLVENGSFLDIQKDKTVVIARNINEAVYVKEKSYATAQVMLLDSDGKQLVMIVAAGNGQKHTASIGSNDVSWIDINLNDEQISAIEIHCEKF